MPALGAASAGESACFRQRLAGCSGLALRLSTVTRVLYQVSLGLTPKRLVNSTERSSANQVSAEARVPLESVRAFYVAPTSSIRRSMSRIIARIMNPRWLRVRFS
jgi:hypothetical protein